MSGLLNSKTVALLAIPLCIAAIAWSMHRHAAAHATLRIAESQHRTIVTIAREIETLNRSTPTIAAGAKPQPNIAGQVNDALIEAGLAPALLTSLSPESDAAIERPWTQSSPLGSDAASTARYRRQSARLTLEPTTMPDLGRFLAAWRTSQPQWTIASISISPIAGPNTTRTRNSASGSKPHDAANTDQELASPSRPVRVNLVIECLYVDRHTLSGITTSPNSKAANP